VALESQATDAGSENENVHTEARTVTPRNATAVALLPVMIQQTIPTATPIPKTIKVGTANDPPGLGSAHPR
jgi:hypothetical protein